MNLKRTLYFGIIAIIMWGCSGKTILNNAPGNGPEATGNYLEKIPSDNELFQEALSDLSNADKEPNYIRARIQLEKLVLQYPQSKWTAGAQALISSLDKIAELQAKLNQERQRAQADHGKLVNEIESIKDNTKQGEEKYKAEIIRLQQENEQLKNDIQQLKRLEVQLEKREKMLR